MFGTRRSCRGEVRPRSALPSPSAMPAFLNGASAIWPGAWRLCYNGVIRPTLASDQSSKRHGRSFTVQEHHAPQGAAGPGPGPAVHAAPREVQVASKAGCPIGELSTAAAGGHPGGQGRQHAQGQYRPGDQARAGRRCRELRRGALRGLRPGRRGGDRRGADRQPQPHRELGPLQLRQAWRCPGRDQQRQLPVQPGRPDQLSSRGGQCRRHARGGDRRRCRGL